VTLRRVFKTDQGWTIEADGQDSAICPGCQSVSRSRHSRYWRSLQDLPIQGTPVILRVHVGRWRCRNAGCKRRIFTERPLNLKTRMEGPKIASFCSRVSICGSMGSHPEGPSRSDGISLMLSRLRRFDSRHSRF
jgi:hypothetical protein